MNWKFWSILGACLMAWLASTHWTPAAATPLYAVRSPNRCDTCHVEPVDWANPAVKDRKCSLDCTICHVSPTGGGLRTPSGQYYGREVLPVGENAPLSTQPLMITPKALDIIVFSADLVAGKRETPRPRKWRTDTVTSNPTQPFGGAVISAS